MSVSGFLFSPMSGRGLGSVSDAEDTLSLLRTLHPRRLGPSRHHQQKDSQLPERKATSEKLGVRGPHASPPRW